jgi:hypothetical protein
MANPVGTFATYQQIGNREDLTDMIYRISPTEVPFTSSAARSKATNTKHEWQTDKIDAAVATNQRAEGDAASNTTVTPTTRVLNYCEIGRYDFEISGTAQTVNQAGRKEMAFQLVKYGLRLKRDMESALSGANGFVSGATGTARVSASLESWLSTNWTTQCASPTSAASTGYITGTGTTAPVDATTVVTVTEANVKAIIAQCWQQGGEPDTILVGKYNKVKVSGFSGILANNIFQQAGGQAKIVAAADAYVSDFGTLKVIPSRFNRDRTLCILDMNYWAVAYLRPFQSTELAIRGDSSERMILAEYTLESRNEAASGKVTDLATS